MFYQPLMTEEERALQQEVRKFVRDEVSHDFIRALDRDEIQYPREYVENRNMSRTWPRTICWACGLIPSGAAAACRGRRKSLPKRKSAFWATPWAAPL